MNYKEEFDRLSNERVDAEKEMRKIFREFVQEHETIEFDPEEEPTIMIINTWNPEHGGDYRDIQELQACSDGSVGIVTDGEEEVYFDEDIDIAAIEFLMDEACKVVMED